jgi:hypothetical protein
MELKLKNIFAKLSSKKILIFLNIFLVLICLVALGFIGDFVNDNVYKVILIEEDVVVDKALMNSLVVNLDIERFKGIIKNIELKTIPREIENFKDLFR